MSITLDSPSSVLAFPVTNLPVIAAELERAILPRLGTATVTFRVVTLQDFHGQSLFCRGSAFGTEPSASQSTWSRPRSRSGAVGRWHLASLGTDPGTGLPGVPRSSNVFDQVVPDAAAALG